MIFNSAYVPKGGSREFPPTSFWCDPRSWGEPLLCARWMEGAFEMRSAQHESLWMLSELEEASSVQVPGLGRQMDDIRRRMGQKFPLTHSTHLSDWAEMEKMVCARFATSPISPDGQLFLHVWREREPPPESVESKSRNVFFEFVIQRLSLGGADNGNVFSCWHPTFVAAFWERDETLSLHYWTDFGAQEQGEDVLMAKGLSRLGLPWQHEFEPLLSAHDRLDCHQVHRDLAKSLASIHPSRFLAESGSIP